MLQTWLGTTNSIAANVLGDQDNSAIEKPAADLHGRAAKTALRRSAQTLAGWGSRIACRCPGTSCASASSHASSGAYFWESSLPPTGMDACSSSEGAVKVFSI
jgi:hypothetical protein